MAYDFRACGFTIMDPTFSVVDPKPVGILPPTCRMVMCC